MNTITLIVLLQSIVNIPVPEGFKRIATDGFGQYLREIKLKKDNTVYLYNGSPKRNQTAQYAVMDISVGAKDLQQCADAAMRLRAEWLFKSRQYGKIVFNSVDGALVRFGPPYNHVNLIKHMERVFSTCNSWSLDRDMKSKKIGDVQIGDVLIKGGFPGHVVMVVDVAVNRQGEKVFMIAQSYMPAQDIHVLKGPIAAAWYPAREGEIRTPEWTFQSDQLKGW